MFEPLANAVHWVQRAGVQLGDTVVIQGPGHQGLGVPDGGARRRRRSGDRHRDDRRPPALRRRARARRRRGDRRATRGPDRACRRAHRRRDGRRRDGHRGSGHVDHPARGDARPRATGASCSPGSSTSRRWRTSSPTSWCSSSSRSRAAPDTRRRRCAPPSTCSPPTASTASVLVGDVVTLDDLDRGLALARPWRPRPRHRPREPPHVVTPPIAFPSETPTMPGILTGKQGQLRGTSFQGSVLVDADVAGEAEHPLAEDVAHDLGRAALDRVARGRAGTTPARSGSRSTSRDRSIAYPAGYSVPAGPSRFVHSEKHALLSSADEQLRDRALRARRAHRHAPRPPRRTVSRSTSCCIHMRHDRRRAAPGCRRRAPGRAPSAQSIGRLAREAAAADRHPLVHQGGERDPPAVADVADAVRVRDADVGEVDLVELGLAGHLAQRSHVDAGRVHVGDEVGEAAVLRHVGVGPGDEQSPAAPRGRGWSRPSGRSRSTRRRRGRAVVERLATSEPAPGLGEQLAPHLFAGEQRPQPLRLAGRRCRGRRWSARPCRGRC